MKHVKLIGLCLVAVFALGGLVASVAQAEGPEWGRCLHIEPAKGKEIKKGNYEDPNCQKVAETEKKGVKSASHKGHYEWYPGAAALCEKKSSSTFKYKDKACSVVAEKKGVPDNKGHYELGTGGKFTASGGAGLLAAEGTECNKPGGKAEYGEIGSRIPRAECETDEPGPFHESAGAAGYGFSGVGPKVECESEHATGEALGSDEVANVSVRFVGCVFFGVPATSHGLPAGEIQVEKLKGRLGYINKSKHEVGVLLEPVTSGGQFAEFEVFEGEQLVHVGVGNATTGAFYEEKASSPGSPNGHDGIISPIVPVDQMTHTFTQDYRIESIENYEPVECKETLNCSYYNGDKETKDYLNIPSHFEGGPLEALEQYRSGVTEPYESAWGPAGEEVSNVNTLEGEAEIKG